MENDVIYTDEIKEGFTFEVEGVLIIGTRKKEIEKAG